VTILDISPVLHEGVAVWPGDQRFSRAVNLAIAEGANIDLSAITTTVHVGAHADAPSHYAADGCGIDEVDLSPYLGPCQVVEVAVARGARIAPEDVADEITEPRVLFRTGTFPDPDDFNDDFAAFAPETIDFLAARGVRLVGIDTPSVDLESDRELVAHRALARHGMANLECLVLSDVPPGRYTLVALPLKIRGADASPVRAVLVTGGW
jgi:arylformamidase